MANFRVEKKKKKRTEQFLALKSQGWTIYLQLFFESTREELRF